MKWLLQNPPPPLPLGGHKNLNVSRSLPRMCRNLAEFPRTIDKQGLSFSALCDTALEAYQLYLFSIDFAKPLLDLGVWAPHFRLLTAGRQHTNSPLLF